MLRTKRQNSFISVLLACFCFISYCSLFATINQNSKTSEKDAKIFEDLHQENKKIGFQVGHLGNIYISKEFPKTKHISHNDTISAILDIKSNREDAYVYTSETLQYQIKRNLKDVRLLEVDLGHNQIIECAWGFSKSPRLDNIKEKANEFIKNAKSNGFISKTFNKWLNSANAKINPHDFKGESGIILHVGVNDEDPPFGFIENNKPVGIEIDLINEFAEQIGAKVEYHQMNFFGLIPALQSGKIDILASALNITEERKKVIDYSDVIYNLHLGILVKDRKDEANNNNQASYNRIEELIGKDIGVIDGGITDQKLHAYDKRFDNFARFTSVADGLMALKTNKIEAMIIDSPVAKFAISNTQGLKILNEKVLVENLGFGLKKGNKLTQQIAKAIATLKANGTLTELENIWLSADNNSKKILPVQDWSNENGTIRYYCSGIAEPMCYIHDDGSVTGFDISVILAIAKELKMHVTFTEVSFSGLIASIQTNKADVIGTSLSITDERLKVIDMVPYYDSYPAFVVRAPYQENSNNSWWNDLKESFNKTFIVENRYKLILNGLWVTTIISICAAILGIILGFIFILISRYHIKIVNFILDSFSAVILGIPAVVFLMVLYYVIFGKVDISPILVAIIGFGISYGTATYGMMKNAIKSIDIGQEEASLALGFTKTQTFFKVIFPQASKYFLPMMRAEFVSMVKMTSIIGYIAGQDLTKATDIIRARTMEAFFPLIITAIIYFVLGHILITILSKIEKNLDPKHRKRIVKGIKA